jgi:hypothetical protein
MKTLIQNFFYLAIVALIIVLTGCKKDEIPASEMPRIDEVEPREGTVGTELTITGANFQVGASVLVGANASTIVEVSSNSIIYAKVPSGISGNVLLSVTVINPGGGEFVFPDAFTAINPELHYINSATKPSGNIGSTVIVEGRAFGDIQGSGQILFSDGIGGTIESIILSEDDWTDEFIITTVPNGTKDGPVIIKTEIGTSNEIEFKVTEAATFSPSSINWTLTTPLPIGVSGHRTVSFPIEPSENITNRYVHVLGGRDGSGTSLNQALVGAINNDGTISSWNNTTSMSSGLSFHATVVATPFNSKVEGDGFVYVFGGIGSSGAPISTVSFAGLNNDGTLKAWNTTAPLPQAIHSAEAVLFRNTIYIAGGATTGNTPIANVYSANINENGHLDAWVPLISLPTAVAYHSLVSFGGYLYVVGGETGIADPDAGVQIAPTDAVYYSRINLRTGEINDWTVNPNSIQKARSKHSTLVLGGNMFVTSGIYSGLSQNVPGSSENIYASMNSDGTVAGFNGATGSNTLFSAGGSNLFNQSGISYIDADGVAHVMIIGGAKYGAPEIKLNNVLFY